MKKIKLLVLVLCTQFAFSQSTTRTLKREEVTKALKLTLESLENQKDVVDVRIVDGTFFTKEERYEWPIYVTKKDGQDLWAHIWKAECKSLESGVGFYDLKQKFLTNKEQYIGVWDNNGFTLDIKKGYNDSMIIKCIAGRWNKKTANANFRYENGVIIFYDPMWEKNNYFILQENGTLRQTHNGPIDISKLQVYKRK